MNRLQAKLEKIGSDPRITAKAVGLRYAADSVKGYTRKRKKEGFDYLDTDGKKISDKEILERIKKLVIPPAWENVWISPYPNGHLQVTGIDTKHRKQYRYHSDWSQIRNQSKFFRLSRFAHALPKIRRQIDADLERRGLPFEKVVALVVKLIEMTNIRIGNDAYKKLYGSFGLTTMQDDHVQHYRGGIKFEFVGKKGVSHSISLESRKLASLVKKCKDIPGQELFQYYDDKGCRHTIGSADINCYIKEISGEDFTAKDFRAWAGSVNALCAFLECDSPQNVTESKRRTIEVLDIVSGKLGNTRTVCRKYYVHPTVIAAYENGTISKYKPKRSSSSGLNAEEKALVKLLETEKIAHASG